MAVDWRGGSGDVVSSRPSAAFADGLVPRNLDADWKGLDESFYYMLEGSAAISVDGMHNETDVNATETFSSPYLMPWPQRTSWIVVFSLMLFVATVGNALVAWIVFAHKRMKTVTNYFLVNLSLADLTMSLFNCMFNFTFMLNSHWPFGEFYCKVSNFIANVTVAASVFTLVAISSDRYIAIIYPLRPRMSKSVARLAISLIWLCSFSLAVPCLVYSKTISHSYPDGEIRIVCIMIWPDGLPNQSQQDFIYNIVFTVVTYLMPVCVMGACYARMSYVLWRSKSIGEVNERQAECIQSKRKVVRMFTVVVTLFVVCWLPYHVYFVYQYIDHNVISYKHVQHIFLAFYWLAMSNTMINPLVYYFMNTRFRQYFRATFVHCITCGRKSLPEGASGTNSTGFASLNSVRLGNQHRLRSIRNGCGGAVPLRQALVRARQQSDSETPLNGSLRAPRPRTIDESHTTLPGNSLVSVRDEPGVVAKEPVAETSANGVEASNGRRAPELPRLIADWPPSMLIQQHQTVPLGENGRPLGRVNCRRQVDDRSAGKDAKKPAKV